ncbi:hypothetical protein DL766_004124 [Monosporascus sp. MC13-8B]|uniref:Uncharacterized protein n=1 Tax=Monosporascus cannonballus TaxID=155416 RepID=A0ABY0HLI7_9PEZI|nr:hypothetical protein DL762_000817 [Monosporascus cannonballus]RYO96364.1 hypothetical protein DL763_003220 [Monosporascus cannonballus]RYP32117.1 hypothetical protein DL766_004124 [Monosporascus sp. MC13-8B]
MDKEFSLYDPPVLNNFSHLSKQKSSGLRGKGQTAETPVEDFSKHLAYSLILLRAQGYPCTFYGDLYGARSEHAKLPSCGTKLADIALARSLYAYGDQNDYFDNPNCTDA